MSRSDSRGVNGLAPVVERALDDHDAVEALGECPNPGWDAANGAVQRVGDARHPMAD